MNISGNTILITGAGTGMGLIAAKVLAARGNRVIMVARDAERLRREAEALPGTLAYACDIADAGQVDGLLDWVRGNAPELNVLFLNAGVTHTYRLFDGTDAARNARLEMLVNFVSAVDLTHRFLPLLESRPNPALIVTTSGVVYAPDTTNPTYSATKAALHSYVQSMRYRLKQVDSPVRLFELVSPLVDTPFASGVKSDAKAKPETVIAELLRALEEDTFDIRPGSSQALYEAWRADPEKAAAMVNEVTGA
ncbi:SDR family oxidoreductase [Aurantimonas endophytica]|uniref:Putative oxidoreductase n=1 Tax=Aurantimonas endophytica TaxID=1522175 RepID=A0A7W6HA02_9HYPH|nr:SDR family NAD(P)-dependent oxidoreductase [Aurantimonas endophytica]MBB4001222.1 putative oxidoreductase [Aurantimonas endophytica]MCO6403128.1 SDR family NAD(P)-dependent oxidoreductase [Aurantimonas endophytica]